MSTPRCAPTKHDDKPVGRADKRGVLRVKCATCGDVFPCRGKCEHVDCCEATGRELPEQFRPIPEETT